MRILPASVNMASFTLLYSIYLGGLVSSQFHEWAVSQLVRVFIHEKHYTKMNRNDLQEVGLVHSSDEMSNDHGAKELAYNRFFIMKHFNPKRE